MRLFTTKTAGKLHTLMAASALTISTLLLSSCSSKDNPIPEQSALMIVNTSPTPATFNVYLDNLKANSGPLPFGGALPYLKLNPGDHAVKFTTGSSTESLITKTITAENQKAHSLFLIGKTDNTGKNVNLDYFFTTDATDAVPSGKALVRFINLSPDATSLILGQKEGTDLFQDQAYKTNSKFIEVEAKKYTFQVKDKASSTVKAEIAETELKAGVVYTVISIGYLNPDGTDQKVTAKLIANQ